MGNSEAAVTLLSTSICVVHLASVLCASSVVMHRGSEAYTKGSLTEMRLCKDDFHLGKQLSLWN